MHPLVVIVFVLIWGTIIAMEISKGAAFLPWFLAEKEHNPALYWLAVVSHLAVLIAVAAQFNLEEFLAANLGVKIATIIITTVWLSILGIVLSGLRKDIL